MGGGPANVELPADAGRQPYAWLTTVGRKTGRERTVELWFGLDGPTLYVLAGGGRSAGWVANSLAHPAVRVRVGGGLYTGSARAVEVGTDEDARARRLLAGKYQGWQEGRRLSGWAARSFCLAVDMNGLDAGAAPPRPPWSFGAA